MVTFFNVAFFVSLRYCSLINNNTLRDTLFLYQIRFVYPEYPAQKTFLIWN